MTRGLTADDFGNYQMTALTNSGAWVAYYADKSCVAIWGTEIEALRHAVANNMQVKFCEWGEEV